MADKLWQFGNESRDYKSAYEYAEKMHDDSTGIIEGTVTEVNSDSKEEIIYSLYLVVPELKNYNYRLIEVVQPSAVNPYPITMKLFGKAAGNVIIEKDVEHKDFEKKLIGFITNPLTKAILNHLKTHLEIKKKYDD